MKNILKLSALTLILAINLFARSIDDIKASGEIVIAVYENFPPYSYIEDGVEKGIDIELGKKVAASLNVKPLWYFTGFDENLAGDLRNTIWRGNLIHKTKADIMFRIPYDYDYLRMTDISTGELENERVTIKGPYQSEKWIIATNKEVIPQIKTLAIFAYQTIGVEIDMLPDLHLSGFARGLLQRNIKHYTNFQDAVNDFKIGNHNITVNKFTVSPVNGDVLNIKSGARIEVCFTSRIKNASLDISFFLRNSHEITVLSTGFMVSEKGEMGDYNVCFEIPANTLNEDGYYFDMFWGVNRAEITFKTESFGFEIHGNRNHNGGVLKSPGVIFPEIKSQITKIS